MTCIAAMVAIGGSAVACTSSSSPKPVSPSEAASAYLRNSPSGYMELAVLHYNSEIKKGAAKPHFDPVRGAGKTWTGDPTYYERLCGASITNSDGTVVDVTKPATYQTLQHQPRRWATFNAWLQDPAVYTYVAHIEPVDRVGPVTGVRAVGPTKACPAFHPVAPPPVTPGVPQPVSPDTTAAPTTTHS